MDDEMKMRIEPATGWIGLGRRVMKGQKGLAVGPFNLFHITQTEVAVPADAVIQ